MKGISGAMCTSSESLLLRRVFDEIFCDSSKLEQALIKSKLRALAIRLLEFIEIFLFELQYSIQILVCLLGIPKLEALFEDSKN
jgi:hypothetical protein